MPLKYKEDLEGYKQELQNDKYLQHKELRVQAVERMIEKIGSKVNVPEYGTGVIVAFEVFKEHWAETRYLIEITDNTAKPILKSLFPDNRMAFWMKDFTFI
jgi:hypothetical protein